MLTQTDQWRPVLDRFQRMALIVGAAGTILTALGALLGVSQFFYSLLFAFFFWLTLTAGSMLMLMIQHLTGGVWGLMLRRMLEAAVMNWILLGLVFIILITGLGVIYPWARPEEVAASEIMQKKAAYLNAPFFIVRGIIYFALMIGLGLLLNRLSDQQDTQPSTRLNERLRNISGPGIPVLVLIFTLATTDWGMSLDPEWFSSMYPTTLMVEGMVAVFAWSILALAYMKSRKLLPYTLPIDRLHDIGKFMFAFSVVWAYVNFSQLLIIWSGNIPEETPWHYYRMNNGWQIPGLMLLIGHFFVPFLGFMSRHPKRNLFFSSLMAGWMVFMQFVFVFWVVMPSFFKEGFHIHLLDITALVGLGGLWVALWARTLKSRPLLPPNDPRMELLARQSAAQEHGGHGSHSAHGESDGHDVAHAH